MNRTVWVVEQGSYSDYRVIGVFSTQANAELIKERINKDGLYEPATVAEWPFDPGIEGLRKGYTPWTVLMQQDGSIEEIRQDDLFLSLVSTVQLWERSQSPYYQRRGVPDVLRGNIWAKDSTHAIKIMNEHRAQFIALGTWKEPQP